ncbi:MAG TPA: hypothetical protein VMW69_03720, partial [Spirochaetia bacterium]|nr:hypothetical protein [Spirochaetia bacterium]
TAKRVANDTLVFMADKIVACGSRREKFPRCAFRGTELWRVRSTPRAALLSDCHADNGQID